jgi:hypothetical protein
VVNEFRLSYMRDQNTLGQQQGGIGPSLASQGFTGIVPGDAQTEGIESIVFNKINFGTSPFSLVQTDGNYQVQHKVSKVSGNHSLQHRPSGNPGQPNDTALIGSLNNGVNGIGFSNLDVAPGPLAINTNARNGQPEFNTALFSLPAVGSPGTADRRFFYGPGLDNWDIALLKETHFTEAKLLEFRMETFNTLNHAQFFGANSVDGNSNDSTFGQVISAMAPRLMQAALGFRF